MIIQDIERLCNLGLLCKFVFYKDSSKYGKLVFGILSPILILILMVPESPKLQFILKSFFQRLIRIPFSKHKSFAHETLHVKKLIYG